MEEPVFDDATYLRAFGLKRKAERDYVDELVVAIGKLDRGLLPAPAPHPLAHLIDAGPASIDKLLALVEQGTDRQRIDAVDALAHVLLGTQSRDANARLKKVLAETDQPGIAALLEKTLAIAGDDATLEEQLKR